MVRFGTLWYGVLCFSGECSGMVQFGCTVCAVTYVPRDVMYLAWLLGSTLAECKGPPGRLMEAFGPIYGLFGLSKEQFGSHS